ncbi:hypothetical protein GOV13_05470 [Candidatus Pacearchaeota archaeon]|nr:hypothetical protein [Candidatus Pacearchaeota archaeon]
MENYDNINATFSEGSGSGSKEYSLRKLPVYELISGNTHRINPKIPFCMQMHRSFISREIIDMEKENGIFVLEGDLEGGTYKEQIARELENGPSLKQRLRNSLSFLRNLAGVLIKGEDKDVLDFLKK